MGKKIKIETNDNGYYLYNNKIKKVYSHIKKENFIELIDDDIFIADEEDDEKQNAMDKLGIKRPTISVRATAVIPEIIDMVQRIIDKGYAYVTKEGNVYFELSKVKSYGKLSGRKLENNLSGERIEVADDKEYPEDFALLTDSSILSYI